MAASSDRLERTVTVTEGQQMALLELMNQLGESYGPCENTQGVFLQEAGPGRLVNLTVFNWRVF
jgi:hypothetical protein